MYILLMGDAEGRKKEASKVMQTTKQSNTTHPRQSLVYVNERCRRKEEGSKQGHANNKAKQHNTPKTVTFPKKIELPVHESLGLTVTPSVTPSVTVTPPHRDGGLPIRQRVHQGQRGPDWVLPREL